ncbi:MAG TPA: hypothetical protein VJJ81_02575 [Candidatus Babeliales bacterium]|nr:hypothetical protein [Candidatus Babeliales bacterium]
MKSVIEEASSLEKAIEQGWIKAGKPKEFSVKIFQEPVKNFLGMTKQTAKVGIFFKESGQATESTGYQGNRPQQRRPYRGNRPNPNRNTNNPNNPSHKPQNTNTTASTSHSSHNTSSNNNPATSVSNPPKEATTRPDGTPAPRRYHRPRRPYQGSKPAADAPKQPNYAGHDEDTSNKE